MILQYFRCFCLHQNVLLPGYNEIPISYFHARLKEHKYGLGGIAIHLGDECLELFCLRSMYDRKQQIHSHYCIIMATETSHSDMS
jgi:hypothetical protein